MSLEYLHQKSVENEFNRIFSERGKHRNVHPSEIDQWWNEAEENVSRRAKEKTV